MRKFLILATSALAGCALSPTGALAPTPAGQLFCAIATANGPIVAKIVVAASGLAPGAEAPAVIVTGLASTVVAADCASAGGVPVSPPASPATAPTIAIAP